MRGSSNLIECGLCHRTIEYLHARLSDTVDELVCIDCDQVPELPKPPIDPLLNLPLDDFTSPYNISKSSARSNSYAMKPNRIARSGNTTKNHYAQYRGTYQPSLCDRSSRPNASSAPTDQDNYNRSDGDDVTSLNLTSIGRGYKKCHEGTDKDCKLIARHRKK